MCVVCVVSERVVCMRYNNIAMYCMYETTSTHHEYFSIYFATYLDERSAYYICIYLFLGRLRLLLYVANINERLRLLAHRQGAGIHLVI